MFSLRLPFLRSPLDGCSRLAAGSGSGADCPVGILAARSAIAIAILVTSTCLSGCNRSRLFSPLAGRSSLETHANQGPTSIQVAGLNATPETSLAEVPQRLVTSNTLSSAPATDSQPSSSHRHPTESSPSASPPAHHGAMLPSGLPTELPIRQVSHGSASHTADPFAADPTWGKSNFTNGPDTYAGVDVGLVLEALKDRPPAVQQEAIRRLVAMSWKKARPTSQPADIDAILAASTNHLPPLPDEVVDRGLTPTRIAAGQTPKSNAAPIAPASMMATNEFSLTDQAINQAFTDQFPVDTARSIAATETKTDATSWNMSDTIDSNAGFSSSFSDQDEIALANVAMARNDQSTGSVVAAVNVAPAAKIESFSDAELYDALLQRLTQNDEGETDAQKQRRQIIKRHLMVLSGDPDRAVGKLDGLTTEEQEYLRHQLLGLWTIIDPNGHPVPSRRFSSALPQIRQATAFLAAATDSLEVRSLEFCTEIEAYGQVKPFPSRRFEAGAEVILYCEVENFVAKKITEGESKGYQTILQGSYDLVDEAGRRVASQSLPADKQISQKQLRDYFIAYQMYLPASLSPGKYQLRLTMEDVHGKKYGQSDIHFEITD